MKQFDEKIWTKRKGSSPLIATAIHNGHGLRDDVARNMKLSESERLREEDPYTGLWVDVAETQIIALNSRFEVDLNRPREEAVYITPDDCWGLDVWKNKPSEEFIQKSFEEYDNYYASLKEILTETQDTHEYFCLFDIHSYNHRRDGADAKPQSPVENPEVNIGTGTMDREKWRPLVDRFIKDLRSFNYMGRMLDVRENVKFKGGNQVKWIHENFANSGCGLAIEFKKFWMDEWTGEKDEEMVEAIHQALASTVPGVLEELEKLKTNKQLRIPPSQVRGGGASLTG